MEKTVAVLFTLTACAWDVRRGRIPNVLVAIGLAAGLCRQFVEYGVMGLLFFWGGAGIPLLLLGALFYFRMLGAGDIKLLCALGGYLGIRASLYCVAAAVFAGGAIAGVLMISRGNARSRLEYFWRYCRSYAAERTWRAYDKGEKQGGTFYFSIPIFISVLLWAGGVY